MYMSKGLPLNSLVESYHRMEMESHVQKLQLREMPEEWEGLPAMAVEVQLDVEEASRKDIPANVLTCLMDEAVLSFNSRGRNSWVGVSVIYLYYEHVTLLL